MTGLRIDDTLKALAGESRELFSSDDKLCDQIKLRSASVDLLRPEYPRPQFVRNNGWLNLNGLWEFELDLSRSGRERKLYENTSQMSSQILVPYCPESKLSGISYTDFIDAVWYRRTVTVPAVWTTQRVQLHVGACDYRSVVYIDGDEVGTHAGGYTPFCIDITEAIAGKQSFIVTIYAEDDVRSGAQAKGKQAHTFRSQWCDYTRTTGIWQTVWLEAVPVCYLASVKATPQLNAGGVVVEVRLAGGALPKDAAVRIMASIDSSVVGDLTIPFSGRLAAGFLSLSEIRPWSPNDPFLYDLSYELIDSPGAVLDSVESYVGLRSVSINGYAIELNGKPVFQRLILDQGFYPDGIYTAPSDLALKRDIELSQQMGFNGARLHQKVFEPRFLYWADKLGYLVWGEMADWGLELTKADGFAGFAGTWVEELERDYNHPSIIGWCPFNEHDPHSNPDSIRSIYKLTKAYDSTRPVIDTSGWVHVETELYDIHDYTQDPAKFAALFESLLEDNGKVFSNNDTHLTGRYVAGQAYFVSEYGGIQWSPGLAKEDGWGYGEAPKTGEEFMNRYKELTEVLLSHPRICGFCYTQLTDIEQEVNGLYYYDRTPKFDPNFFRNINAQQAAIEIS